VENVVLRHAGFRLVEGLEDPTEQPAFLAVEIAPLGDDMQEGG